MRFYLMSLVLLAACSSPKAKQPKSTNPVVATAVVATPKEEFTRLDQITDTNATELWNEMAVDLNLNPKDGWKLPTSTTKIVRDIEGNGGCYCFVERSNWHPNGRSTLTVGGCRSIHTDPNGSTWLIENRPYESDEGITEINYYGVGCEQAMRGEDDHDE